MVGLTKGQEECLVAAFISAIHQRPERALIFLKEALQYPRPSANLTKALEYLAKYAYSGKSWRLFVIPEESDEVVKFIKIGLMMMLGYPDGFDDDFEL